MKASQNILLILECIVYCVQNQNSLFAFTDENVFMVERISLV